MSVYPACTSLWQIEGFWPFSRYVKSTTYAVSIALLVRSPPPTSRMPFRSISVAFAFRKWRACLTGRGAVFRTSAPRRRFGKPSKHSRPHDTSEDRESREDFASKSKDEPDTDSKIVLMIVHSVGKVGEVIVSFKRA